ASLASACICVVALMCVTLRGQGLCVAQVRLQEAARLGTAPADAIRFGQAKRDCTLLALTPQSSPRLTGGLLVYLNQEGRGIGLRGKVMAYQLQVLKGRDTVAANRAINQPDDAREYVVTFSASRRSTSLPTNPRYVAVRDILRHFGIHK